MSELQAGDIIPRKIRKPVCRSSKPASAVRVASFGCLPASALVMVSQNSGRFPAPPLTRSAYSVLRWRIYKGGNRSHNISRACDWVLLVPFGAVGVVGVPVSAGCSGALSCSFHPLPPLQLSMCGQCFRRAVGGTTELSYSPYVSEATGTFVICSHECVWLDGPFRPQDHTLP